MVGAVVGQVLDGDRGLGGEHAVVVELVAGGLQQCAGLFQSAFVVVVDAVRIKVALLGHFGLEDTAVAVGHAVRDEGVRSDLAGLADILADVLTVDQDVHGLAHAGSLLRGLALEDRAVGVEGSIVGAEVVDNVELGVAQQGLDLVVRDGVDHVDVAGVVSGVDRGVVSREHELHLLELDVVSAVPVRVLFVGHGGVMVPFGADERAVADKASVLAPGTGRSLPAVSRFHSGLLHRVEGRERHEVFHVRAGRGQSELEGGVVGSGDSQIIGIALEAGEHVAIVGSGRFGSGALPGVLEVSGGQVAAVGPLQALTQSDDEVQAVFADGVAGGAGRLGVAFGVVGVQAGEGSRREAGAVDGAVECRIQEVGLGGEVQAERRGTVVHVDVLEELCAEQVGVHAFDIILEHVDVVVVVERDDAVVAHQDVLGLVHQLGALGKVGLGLDLIDHGVVLVPVVDRVDERVADERSGIGNLFTAGISGVGALSRAIGLSGRAGSRAVAVALTGTGGKAEQHHERKEQSNASFHFVFSSFNICSGTKHPPRFPKGKRT